MGKAFSVHTFAGFLGGAVAPLLLLGVASASNPRLAFAVAALAGFVALALLLAGTLPGVGTLAVAIGLYLVLLLTGGMVVPLSELPSGLATAARVLPAAPLTEVITGSLGGGGVEAWASVASRTSSTSGHNSCSASRSRMASVVPPRTVTSGPCSVRP